MQPFKDDRSLPKSRDATVAANGGRSWTSNLVNHGSVSESSSSGTETPPLPRIEDIRVKYTAIPLSDILHPQSDELSYPVYCTQNAHLSRPPANGNLGIHIVGEDVGEDDVEEIPERQRLKFLDPGMQELTWNESVAGGRPRPIGGMLEMLNTFNAFPVKTSLRNAELFNFCEQSPYSFWKMMN